MIIQELYFQNYYNLGNPNRNPPEKQNGQLSGMAKCNMRPTPLFITISSKPRFPKL
jgi:hypothetical protein